MANGKNGDLGKKVFFLYPHSVIQNELVELIARNQYEVYLVRDHSKLARALPDFRDSIVFINIDEQLSVEEWEEYIKEIRGNPATSTVQVGILTYNEDKELARRFLMDLGVQGGFVLLKLGLKESAKIILQTLVATEAKGRRKFVRAILPEGGAAKFNIKSGDLLLSGSISDISIGAMACFFDQEPTELKDHHLTDIQLRLKGRIIMVSGKLAGSRDEDGRRSYIILFEQFRSDQDKNNLSSFIIQSLQSQMDRKLENVT
jgi:hypothetical protein